MDNAITVLDANYLSTYVTADEKEQIMIEKAANLLTADFPDHALLEIWNASVHNLRRRIELYSIDIFLSTVQSLSGRKKYKNEGDTLSERWGDVDDAVLLEGAEQIGVLNKKAAKALEMVNWMRNHASPAHDNEDSVSREDVLGLVAIIKSNLFDHPLPDPVHSPITLLNQIKNEVLTSDQIDLFKDQIDNFSNKDIRTIFGFATDAICSGEQPKYDNVIELFESIWIKSTEELKTNMGLRIHNYMIDPTKDTSSDSQASDRLYAAILSVDGIKYIPDQTRAVIYRRLACKLASAKDTSYGWSLENSASRALKQVGIHIPSIAFEEVYQEILSVWCGNYWGRSEAYNILREFIFGIDAKKKVKVAKLFLSNDRVKSELGQSRPQRYALSLLDEIKSSLTNQSQINEIDTVINEVQKL